jgi:hypothetical protein
MIGTVRNVGYKFVRPGRGALSARDTVTDPEADADPDAVLGPDTRTGRRR